MFTLKNAKRLDKDVMELTDDPDILKEFLALRSTQTQLLTLGHIGTIRVLRECIEKGLNIEPKAQQLLIDKIQDLLEAAENVSRTTDSVESARQ